MDTTLQSLTDSQLSQLLSYVRRELARRYRRQRKTAVEYLTTAVMEFDKQGLGPPEVLLDGLTRRFNRQS